jgi:hypothetical protein
MCRSVGDQAKPGHCAGSTTGGTDDCEGGTKPPVEKAITMAASLIIEQERGTYVGVPRGAHQGYYAGKFTSKPREQSETS